MTPAAEAEALELDQHDLEAMVDEQARRYLHMSGAEFIAAVKAGHLPEHPVTAHLLLLTGARSGSI